MPTNNVYAFEHVFAKEFFAMKKLLTIAVIAAMASQAQAGVFHFTGNIANHNDVVQINFSLLNNATNVRVWTDSFQSATNFDPITALWNRTTGALIDQNDDNDAVAPGQTWYDSGFTLASLAAGDYAFTIAAYGDFAQGNNLSDPQFAYSNQAPIPLSQWCQPASSCNMGTFWSVWLDGVDSAINNNTPEPGSLALAGLGLAGIANMLRRRKQA